MPHLSDGSNIPFFFLDPTPRRHFIHKKHAFESTHSQALHFFNGVVGVQQCHEGEAGGAGVGDTEGSGEGGSCEDDGVGEEERKRP